MERCHGMTLWELLWVLGIAATLLAVGVPGFRTFVLESRRTADINALVVAIQLSRSEAAKRARPAVLCKTADGATCGGPEVSFDDGWMVFINEDGVRPPQRSATEALLYVHQPEMVGSITSNRRLYEFRPFTWRSTNGTITFCDERGATNARAVIVSYTGRPRVSARGPGRALVCAGFP